MFGHTWQQLFVWGLLGFLAWLMVATLAGIAAGNLIRRINGTIERVNRD